MLIAVAVADCLLRTVIQRVFFSLRFINIDVLNGKVRFIYKKDDIV